MTELWQLAKLIRSKNAGPFLLTFDVICKDRKSYERIRKSQVLSAQSISRLYGVSIDQVQFFELDRMMTFKASIPRPVFSGDPLDTDVFGGQFHSRLVQLKVDNEAWP
jgi:hypothetical protein